jgi:hypothetical protein
MPEVGDWSGFAARVRFATPRTTGIGAAAPADGLASASAA